MSTTNGTSPILPGTTQPEPDPATATGAAAPAGADTAPGDIIVHSCATRGRTTLVIHLAGEIDRFSAGPLRAMLASAAADGYRSLVLDTSRVTFCDSGFLDVLDRWMSRGLRLRMEPPSPAVRRLLCAVALSRAGRPPRSGRGRPGAPRRDGPASVATPPRRRWAVAASAAGMS
ncbi:STAS domain-containing protein [Streptomyces sp. NPDC053755]|uniref:STAS domain-containing protein n=1 Tax=Streptomyces sp. NPDC053755 TaxID=3155815 RepID=UPI00343795BC